MKPEIVEVKVSIVRVPVPPSHPRALNLQIRERMVEGVIRGLVALEGLIAHGRGECFDYLIGEETRPFALKAAEAAAAALLTARRPVISVNGNMAALCSREIVQLASTVNAGLEVNLFYRSRRREEAVAEALKQAGAEVVLGVNAQDRLTGLGSLRGLVDSEGIGSADVVLAAIEDGDRVEALRRLGKTVIAVDLNPLSRSAKAASITIIDNLVRALPQIRQKAENLKGQPAEKLRQILESYDNHAVIAEALKYIGSRLSRLAEMEACRRPGR